MIRLSTTRWHPAVVTILVLVAASAGGCVDTLPDEDLRITTATPIAKLSAALLWKEFQDDAMAARGKYWGQAVEISGLVTSVSDVAAPDPHVLFAQQETHGVRARLILDQGPAILAAAKPGERLTLKCFCDDMSGGDLMLRSCVQP